ncbi:hypothetical protein N7462_008717 [Penicillium macrosclerotiorum]|uniref:uncharacterized protein n=1 Tax=Penicillium macrosclerotiorum TaxID=303699 RepID=UPI002548FF67|nr:uncharacterized protein N7462_008717 [Penicillium macrosclerotiorum]KAJ5675820.1 hypothetical protein N7462_008717 [Penicillium macrosclerotiorum]
MQLSHALGIWLLYATTATADFLGPTYPAPVDLTSSDSLVSAAWKNLTATFDAYLQRHVQNKLTTPLAGVENITFSTGLLSIHDLKAQTLQYHYTSPEIAGATNGTHKVNGDSIYRIASASKLFTVYAGMLALTEEQWHRPLTEINPAFSKVAEQGDKDPAWKIEWEKITPWALASQSSGIPREGWPAGDSLYNYTVYEAYNISAQNPVTAWGVPPVDILGLGKCWNISAVCDGQNAIRAVRSQPPVFLPWAEAMYANDNFMMLGLMISNLTGHKMEDIYQDELFRPLHLTSTSATEPTNPADFARSVIVGNPSLGFLGNTPLTIPSGGLYSTFHDLAKFGSSILNNTLLPDNTTRKWMRPQTHTASLTYSIGAPWEILRYIHPDTGKITDLYTKLGDSGWYGSNIVLIPSYGAGFTILNAGTAAGRGELSNIILDYIVTSILPALEAQAAREAITNYVGTYVSTNPSLNSSLTIAFNQSDVITSKSGLSITEWISNGTNVMSSSLLGARPRLLPSISKQTSPGQPGQVAFQASFNKQLSTYFSPGAAKTGAIGPFTGQYMTNYDWLSADATHYAGLPAYLLVFDVDGNGKATAVSPAAMRAKYERKK